MNVTHVRTYVRVHIHTHVQTPPPLQQVPLKENFLSDKGSRHPFNFGRGRIMFWMRKEILYLLNRKLYPIGEFLIYLRDAINEGLSFFIIFLIKIMNPVTLKPYSESDKVSLQTHKSNVPLDTNKPFRLIYTI